MNNVNHVTVKFFNDDKGFGFFRQKSGPDIFVHFSVLLRAGFQKADMVMDKPAVVEFNKTPRGLVATVIHSIGAKRAIATHRRTVIDHNDGKFIIKVVDLRTEQSHFEVRRGGVDGEQIGADLFCLNDARKLIGKTIQAPIVEGHGFKTNIVRPRHDGKAKAKSAKEKQAA